MLDSDTALAFNTIADISALVVFFGMVVFVLLYSSFYRWKKRKAGKSVLFLALAFITIAFISSLAIWIGPDFWLRPAWRMLGWLFGVFSVGYLLYALLYNWKDRTPIRIDARQTGDRE